MSKPRRSAVELRKQDLPDFSDLEVLPFLSEGGDMNLWPPEKHVGLNLPRLWHADGTPWEPAATTKQYARQLEVVFEEQRTFALRSGPFFRHGHAIRLLTDFTTADANYERPGQPPILWETMITISGSWGPWKWSYASPSAALRGHRLITNHLRLQQRTRSRRMWGR